MPNRKPDSDRSKQQNQPKKTQGDPNKPSQKKQGKQNQQKPSKEGRSPANQSQGRNQPEQGA